MRIALAALVITLITGCAGSDGRRVLHVSAAASLTDAFGAIEDSFEAIHPDVDIVLNLAGSSTLREQILGGAQTDVFASANMANMDEIVAAGLATQKPRVFAHNRLQIAVPSENRAEVSGLDDFANERLFLGLCSEGVPCGDLALQALAAAGVEPAIDTYEPDVRSLLIKIENAELDAGITYVTDVASAGDVDGIAIPEDFNVVADYPVAVLTAASSVETAHEFVDFVLSADGRAIMSGFGFSLP